MGTSAKIVGRFVLHGLCCNSIKNTLIIIIIIIIIVIIMSSILITLNKR
jgi:hypothetical protein